MPPQLALYLSLGFTCWLFYRYREREAGVSTALWIPLAWLFILSSRPVSAWMGAGETADQQLDGSPLDSLVFLVLIVAGGTVFSKRRGGLGEFFPSNPFL